KSLTKRNPVAVAMGKPGFQGKGARKDGTSGQARLIAGPFLVRPVDNGKVQERTEGTAAAGRIEGNGHATGGDDAERTIETAAAWLRVEMRAGEYPGCFRPRPVEAGELVADRVVRHACA